MVDARWPFPPTSPEELERIEIERDVYKEYYEAKVAWESAQDPASDNKKFLPAAERYQRAHVAVKQFRGEMRGD